MSRQAATECGQLPSPVSSHRGRAFIPEPYDPADLKARRCLIAAIIDRTIQDALYRGFAAQELRIKAEADRILRRPTRYFRHLCSLIDLDADSLSERYIAGRLEWSAFWDGRARGKQA